MFDGPYDIPRDRLKCRPDILLASGRYFNLLDPDPASITIQDIAHGLAHVCRFAGHTCEFYSVAQHSELVSRIVEDADAFEGLMHDASEAFIGDVAAPLKQLLPDYRAVEQRITRAIAQRFNLAPTLPISVKRADRRALATEQRDLMPPHSDPWPIIEGVRPLTGYILPQPPAEAKANFLRRFDVLVRMGLGTP